MVIYVNYVTVYTLDDLSIIKISFQTHFSCDFLKLMVVVSILKEIRLLEF